MRIDLSAIRTRHVHSTMPLQMTPIISTRRGFNFDARFQNRLIEKCLSWESNVKLTKFTVLGLNETKCYNGRVNRRIWPLGPPDRTMAIFVFVMVEATICTDSLGQVPSFRFIQRSLSRSLCGALACHAIPPILSVGLCGWVCSLHKFCTVILNGGRAESTMWDFW